MELDNRLYYQVGAWMMNDLHLKGNELKCYAVIYSLSQLGQGLYSAGLDFLAKFMQVSQPTASSALDGLLKKGLIDKRQVITEKGRRVVYFCKDENNKNLIDGVNKNLIDGVNKNFMDPNKYNIIDNKDNNKKESKDSKKERTRFIKPTLEQLKEYLKEKDLQYVDAEEFFNYFESVGWVVGKNRPMKSWMASCVTWNNRHKPKASYYDALPEDDDTVLRFKKWMRENHTQIGFVEKPLTCEGYIRLQKQYGRDEVINQLDYIDANIGKFKYSDIEASIRLYFEKEQ